jgi:uncharacterized protein YbjT (DUF2867 family)
VVILTGATGYIGGRLLALLEAQGYTIRCLTRRPEALQGRIGESTTAVAADMFDTENLTQALGGGDIAYYLVHSMGTAENFEERDREAARNFGDAAREAGIKRIIYLGGLGGDVTQSPHLRSRQEVGHVLRESGVPVTEFRASVVLGSGSLSFELIRSLVERLPVMTTPTWVAVSTQPIGVNDLLAYLVAALDHPTEGNRIYEIGGDDQMSYGELMQEYARQRGLRRIMIPVPFLSPGLSSRWLALITPVYARVGRKLIESLRVPTVVTDSSAREEFDVKPESAGSAIAHALRNEDQVFAATRWSDALSSSGEPRAWSGARFGSRLVDSRTTYVNASPEEAFVPVERIGGASGWYYATWLWRLRGWIDRLFGGPGLRRGRTDPYRLRVGDTLDWWRVEKVEPGRLVRLSAELGLPGRGWLEFEVEPADDGKGSIIRQTAEFDPVGVKGLLYWYGSSPAHTLIFSGMLNRIKQAAEAQARSARVTTR